MPPLPLLTREESDEGEIDREPLVAGSEAPWESSCSSSGRGIEARRKWRTWCLATLAVFVVGLVGVAHVLRGNGDAQLAARAPGVLGFTRVPGPGGGGAQATATATPSADVGSTQALEGAGGDGGYAPTATASPSAGVPPHGQTHGGLASQDCDGEGLTGGPVKDLHVHFMMMVVDSVPHKGIWKEFFKGGSLGTYSAWLHCKFPDKCFTDLTSAGLVSFILVPSVYNAWCEDLLSPMLQLLKTAMATPVAPPGVAEKFVFLSGDSLPLKPLRLIQAELGKHPDASDFCIYPRRDWFPSDRYDDLLIPSASQWSVLSRADAEVLLARLPAPAVDHALNMSGVVIGDVTYDDFHNSRHCIDEGVPFWAIFGAYSLMKLRNAPPGIGPLKPSSHYVQGCCRVLGFQQADITTAINAMVFQDFAQHTVLVKTMKEIVDDPDSEVVGPATPHAHHGVEVIWRFDRLSPKGLRIMRNSPFLFARKFPGDAVLPNFATEMFS